MLESRWNRREAMRITGTTSMQTSVNCQEYTNSRANVKTMSSAADRNCCRPNCTSSPIESMSAVMRETSTPACSRS